MLDKLADSVHSSQSDQDTTPVNRTVCTILYCLDNK